MSKENVKKFFEEIGKNTALKEKYMSVIKESHEEACRKMIVTMVDFAKTSGFAFGENDLKALHSDMMDKANSNSELSDDDLMTAAGGASRGLMIFGSIATVGVWCAVMSVGMEIGMGKGGCKDFMKGD